MTLEKLGNSRPAVTSTTAHLSEEVPVSCTDKVLFLYCASAAVAFPVSIPLWGGRAEILLPLIRRVCVKAREHGRETIAEDKV